MRSAVGNVSLMAATGAGCARTLRPLRHTCALVKERAIWENAFIAVVFLSFSSSLATYLPSYSQLSLSFFHQVITINHDLHLHLSGFTPLRKILTVNHCLHSPQLQHPPLSAAIPGCPPSFFVPLSRESSPVPAVCSHPSQSFPTPHCFFDALCSPPRNPHRYSFLLPSSRVVDF